MNKLKYDLNSAIPYDAKNSAQSTGTMEDIMSELISNRGECKDPQNMFAEYNQLYFGGRLPQYKVLLTIDHSRCERRKRRIYINPDGEDVSVILLHEMVHAAVGSGHGKKWLDEVRRLIELGAPLQEELQRYSTGIVATSKHLLDEFFDAGMDAPPDWTWPEIRRYLGYRSGITDKHGSARSRRLSRFLRRARSEFSRGRAFAHP